ncbi:MAG: hypothetical protein R3A47_03405 [Polyangiales bacterium]
MMKLVSGLVFGMLIGPVAAPLVRKSRSEVPSEPRECPPDRSDSDGSPIQQLFQMLPRSGPDGRGAATADAATIERELASVRGADGGVDHIGSSQSDMNGNPIRGSQQSNLTSEQFYEKRAAFFEASKARIAQMRAAIAERHHLNPAQMEQVDRIVNDLNSEMSGYADEMLQISGVGISNAPPRSTTELVHEVSGTLVEKQNELDSVLAQSDQTPEPPPSDEPSWRDPTAVINLVDPAIFKPYLDQMPSGPTLLTPRSK